MSKAKDTDNYTFTYPVFLMVEAISLGVEINRVTRITAASCTIPFANSS